MGFQPPAECRQRLGQ